MSDNQSHKPEGIESTLGDEEFSEKLEQFLKEHNKTRADLKVLDVPDYVQREVVERIHKIEKVNTGHGGSYRRLRTFSGKYPRPNGELPFSSWVQHAQQMVEDPGLSEGDKRSRLAESLAPPALSIYRKAAQTLGFCVSAEELLSQLGEAFGVACEVEDLLSLFRDTYQEAGEKPSYLARLEDRLNQAVQFGGVPYGDIDRLRLSQYVRG